MIKIQNQSHQPDTLPFLRWAGSKKQHLHFLKLFWSEDYIRYVEPFAGSACLFFSINPRKALLGDINKELITTYREVRNNPNSVAKMLNSFPKNSIHYYKIRKIDPNSLNPIKRAARFIYLNRYCFNGLYRTNSRGEFNVPYGGEKSGKIPTLLQLKKSAGCLKNAKLICGDFRKTIEQVKLGDFVYLDPPYAVSNRRVFREYSATPFSTNDIFPLSETLRKIDKIGATFVLSYADCAEARKAFSKWKIRRILTRRSVAGFLGARRNYYEICVTNSPNT
jgi:DNA adenine methylase